jgi:basic secretory peptidase family protein
VLSNQSFRTSSAVPTVYNQIPVEASYESSSKKEAVHVKPPRIPKLRLEVRDLYSKGAQYFLSTRDLGTILEKAVAGVLDILYTPHSNIPPTRSVTLIIREMDGVAYTTGSDLDNDHKEIHFSTKHIERIPAQHREKEIIGVIRHEMVHCWQWNAKGTCPGGLIEGIADFVRLSGDLGPPHWKHEWKNCNWDAGYERTAYFLDYLERRFGKGTIIRMNERLRDKVYHERAFWDHCCGSDVDTLWKDYCKHCEGKMDLVPETWNPEVEVTGMEGRKMEYRKRADSEKEDDKKA